MQTGPKTITILKYLPYSKITIMQLVSANTKYKLYYIIWQSHHHTTCRTSANYYSTDWAESQGENTCILSQNTHNTMGQCLNRIHG
jgi:hypothetical protein